MVGRRSGEAQRYPDDFNGIIAGAPEIIAGPLNAELQTWQYRVNTDSSGNAILTSDQLPALHTAVIAAGAGTTEPATESSPTRAAATSTPSASSARRASSTPHA